MNPIASVRSVVAWAVRRPRRTRRARSAVLLGIVAAIASQLGLSLAVESVRPHWRDPEFFHRKKNLTKMARWNERNTPDTPVVVVLGSSRPELGLSSDYVQKGYGPERVLVYNCSQSGCQPLKQRVNLGRLLDDGLVPDYLLLEVFPPALTHRGPLDDQTLPQRFSRADLKRVEPYLTNPEVVRKRWAQSRIAPWSALRLDLMSHAGLADWLPTPVRTEFLWRDMRPDGWIPYYPASYSVAAREAGFARARGQYAGVLSNFQLHPQVAQAYREMLAECRARGIRAALFLMPESPAFRGLYSQAARKQIQAYLTELAAEFGAPAFDATGWIDLEDRYSDGHHLLGPGAEEFSERFGREFLRPWLSGGK